MKFPKWEFIINEQMLHKRYGGVATSMHRTHWICMGKSHYDAYVINYCLNRKGIT